MIAQAGECFASGCELVLVEGAELVDAGGQPRRPMLKALSEGLDLTRVLFELPGPWIAGVSEHDIHRMRRDLISRYGTQVNIGNVAPDDVLSLEAYRRGLGVNAGQS